MISASQPTKWYYPDGTASVSEPSDGQFFYVWEEFSQYPKPLWQWNKSKSKWVICTPTPMGTDFDLVEEFERMVQEGSKQKKCECGSESVGSNIHSKWCQKWS